MPEEISLKIIFVTLVEKSGGKGNRTKSQRQRQIHIAPTTRLPIRKDQHARSRMLAMVAGTLDTKGSVGSCNSIPRPENGTNAWPSGKDKDSLEPEAKARTTP